MRTNTPFYVHIEAEVSMVDLASLMCFTKLCKNILTLTKPRANAQLVVKSVVIPITRNQELVWIGQPIENWILARVARVGTCPIDGATSLVGAGYGLTKC